MSHPLTLISSMATRLLLEELVSAFEVDHSVQVQLVSVGGVEAVQRIQNKAAFDIAVLASNAIEGLVDDNHLTSESVINWLRSRVAIAVPSGFPHPDIRSETALREAILAAPSIAYSTGPSGKALAGLFEQWGVQDELNARLKVPPPGTPVGRLLAQQEVVLGFQQYAELKFIDGIDVVGFLPESVAIETVFSVALSRTGQHRSEAAAFLAFLQTDFAMERAMHYGMESPGSDSFNQPMELDQPG